MLRRLEAWLKEKVPRIEDYLGPDGRLEYVLSAYGASLLVHVLLIAFMLTVSYLVGSEAATTIQASVVDTALPDLERVDATELAETDRPVTLEPVLSSSSPNLSPMIVEQMADPNLEVEPLAFGAMSMLPTATTLSSQVQLRGDGAEHVEGVEGAVDRLALEILRQLEKGRLLVVWAFDASGSLVDERQRLAEHVERVYDNILGRSEGQQAMQGGSLLTSVIGFGQDRKVLTQDPVTEPSEIGAAIRGVYLDESGIENTFTMVADVAHRFGRFEHDGNPFRTMLIVVTDEVGEDEAMLEKAIAASNSAGMPVYVLGSPALFGREKTHVDFTHPRTGQRYVGLEVRQGPESVALESIRLPFWYDGPQFDELDAGFGPFALSRLAGSTGGIYFVTRMGRNRASFNPAGMREYKPDWVSRAQYETAVARNPLRASVLMASQITQQNLPSQPGLNFPAAGTPDFKEVMDRNQETVARVLYTVEEALVPISQAQPLRDRETSRRWQAHYDLIRARLLAMKVRCYEYNWACGQMKVNPRKFTNPQSNAWRLEPDPQVQSSDRASQAAAEATTLLERVVSDHHGTPWALLAQRELKDTFGFRWVETYVPPPPARNAMAEAAAKKARPKAANTPPPVVPKL